MLGLTIAQQYLANSTCQPTCLQPINLKFSKQQVSCIDFIINMWGCTGCYMLAYKYNTDLCSGYSNRCPTSYGMNLASNRTTFLTSFLHQGTGQTKNYNYWQRQRQRHTNRVKNRGQSYKTFRRLFRRLTPLTWLR